MARSLQNGSQSEDGNDGVPGVSDLRKASNKLERASNLLVLAASKDEKASILLRGGFPFQDEEGPEVVTQRR